jgi:hypothetical protein
MSTVGTVGSIVWSKERGARATALAAVAREAESSRLRSAA